MTSKTTASRARLVAATFALLFSSAPASAQSFDCAKAEMPDEKAICASGKLSALDDEMAALYHDIMTHALMGTAGETRDTQNAFLTLRHGCGDDDKCLAGLYRQRIAELKTIKEDVGQGAAQ